MTYKAVNILGVDVHDISDNDFEDSIEFFLNSGEKHYMTTPNPEMLVASVKDDELREILKFSDLAVPDGTGIILASVLYGNRIQKRITGVDIAWKLIDYAEREQFRILLFGGKKNIAQLAATNIKKVFPKIYISNLDGFIVEDPKLIDREILESINRMQPDILLVALGHGKQEKFIYHNLDKLPSVKLAVGIGGTFDFMSGTTKRAPLWMRKIGLEWVFRFLKEPKKRSKRIFNATMVFPYFVLKDRFFKIK